ncbi:MAG: cytochrome C [Vicinamibacterales bacterium]
MVTMRRARLSRWLLVGGIATLLVGLNAGQRLQADDRDGRREGETKNRDRDDDGEQARIRRGFKIAPVLLNLRGKDRDLVGLGSYLVNAVGGCNDCHTNPPYAQGGNPHLGEPKVINGPHYLAGGAAFGPFISRNITPDPSTGRPAGLTLREFIEVMRTGVDPATAPPHVPSATNDLLQVMPWPVYQDMTTRDLRAIYEYLRAIPHAEPAP